MSLTFTDVIYDEAGLPDIDTDPTGTTDSNVASLSAALSTKIGVLSLSSQYYTGPNAVTQYAQLTDFVTSPNATVTNYVLSSNTSGGAFSTSGAGVATGMYVGANEIFLYGTSDLNVVVGRIGSGTTGSSIGKIAIIIALDETKDGSGHVTDTALGIEMFAPLTHSDGSHVDDGDTTTMLSNALFVYETHSTISIVPFDNFDGVPSGQDAYALIGPSNGSSGVDLLTTGFVGTTPGTVNVSTQGLGANAQAVDNGASLRIDIVNANSTDFANQMGSPPGAHSDLNLSYQNHVQAIQASFELTQNNPTGKAASLTVSAYEVTTNLQGHTFVTDAAASEGTLVHIATSNVIIRDDAGNDITSTFGGTITQSGDGNSVLITGLTATEHVDFTADSQFDRFVVTNTQTSASDKTTFDVGDIRVSTITGGTGHDSGDLGPHMIFEDGGPSISATGTPPSLTVDETTLGATGDDSASFANLFTNSYGADGAGTLAYTLGIKSVGVNSGLVDTATGHGIFLYISGSNVVGRVGSSLTTANNAGTIAFTISVDSSGNVNLDQARAIVHPTTTNPNDSKAMSAADLVILTATITDGDGDHPSAFVNIGQAFHFLDDGPDLAGSTAVNVANATTDVSGKYAHTGSGSFSTFATGNDGFGSFKFTGTPDTAGHYTWSVNGTGTVLTESLDGVPLFTVTLASDGTYSVAMLSTIPFTPLPLDPNKIHAGGPNSHTLDVGVKNGTDDVLITSDPGPINASNGNVGVSNGNIDQGESLKFELYTDISHATLIPFYGINVGTKSAQAATYHVTAVLDSNHTTVDLGNFAVGKNGTIVVPSSGVLYDSITITDVSGNAIKIGLSTISLLLPPDDATFTYGVQLKDGDGDPVNGSITVNIDGNNDHSIDSGAVTPAAAIFGAAALSASTYGTTSLNSSEMAAVMDMQSSTASHSDVGAHWRAFDHLSALQSGDLDVLHSHLLAHHLIDL